MDDSKKRPDFDDENQITQLNFIRSDLALCSTLTDLAKNKLMVGDREDAQRLLEKACKIHSSIQEFVAHIASPQARNEITKELEDRRATLDSVKQML